MNGLNFYTGHCKTGDFHLKEESLFKNGFQVVIIDFFKNTLGQDFVKFAYYPKGTAASPISPIKKSPSVERIAKENLSLLDRLKKD